MIIVDTSVLANHLAKTDQHLVDLLNAGQVLIHAHVAGEIALGNLRQRATTMSLLANLPQATLATDEEVMGLIETASLSGTGIGYTDAHLLASAKLDAARLWTRDKRLLAQAERLKLDYKTL